MPQRRDLTLTTPLADVFTPRQAEHLASLGMTSVGKLVAHLPMRHERLEAESPIAGLTPGSLGCARGEVSAVREVRGRGRRLEAVLIDETGRLDVVWFNGSYLAERVRPGVRLRVQGKVQARAHQVQMVNPRLEVLDPQREEPASGGGRLRPVYPASEVINSGAIEKLVEKILPDALALLRDHLPQAFREERDLPDLASAYRMQHQPQSEDDVLRSRRRLAYDELLLLQLGVAMKREHLRHTMTSPALRVDDAVDARIRARFPFTPTPGQEQVIRDLRADLSRPTPTNRLIQGDVGSGKTLVALYAMLAAVASGHQATLMAPTEILAEQHFATISGLLQGSRVRVALLTGGTPAGERAVLLESLSRGEVDLLIGTHALLGEGVTCKSLAVAVIDEQHRFGVSQRAMLRSRAGESGVTPHVLVMTATPIPRSLALTLFGDLDISVIEGLPPGRVPVRTRALSSHARGDAYAHLREAIAQGRQAYVVVPAVEPGRKADARVDAGPSGTLVDVQSMARALRDVYAPEARVATLHADLARATRERVMERFRAGEVDALVCTTVIEVGVDVPNATVMIVEQADRFGLAQLHQLRGRVGRSEHPGACFLIADPTTPEGQTRLQAMESTNDGFELAEKDLQVRGMGEIFGLRQSGLPPFRVADAARDRDLLRLARADAQAWISRSPTLSADDEKLLRSRLMKTHGKFLGLGDVG